MAHDPVTKAKCILDLVGGMGPTAAARKHTVPLPTVKEWAKEIESGKGKTLPQTRQDLFIETYSRLGVATMEMFIVLCETVADPDFLKSKTIDDAIKLATFARDSFMSFERAHSNGSAPALEAPTERVEAEVVE